MRVVAGRHRGRRLATPADDSVRPTADRAREGVFNVLAHGRLGADGGSVLAEARVLDVFAGTGAMGLEALSRGAAHATFMERDPVALESLKRNIASLGEEERSHVSRADATRPPYASTSASLVFLDPPYGAGLAAPALTALAEAGWLASGAVVVLEHEDTVPSAPTAGFEAIDERRYGRARFTFLRFLAASESSGKP